MKEDKVEIKPFKTTKQISKMCLGHKYISLYLSYFTTHSLNSSPYFGALGISSLNGHFNKIDKKAIS